MVEQKHQSQSDDINPYSQLGDDLQHGTSEVFRELGKVITTEIDPRDGQEIRIIIETTENGVVRDIYKDAVRFYHCYETHDRLIGIPFFSYQYGHDPRKVFRNHAYGVIAVGQWAKGILCLAQFSMGVVNISQFSLGLLFSLSQFGTGASFIGQFGIGGIFCLAQFGMGTIVIAQMGIGEYVLAQFGIGSHVWQMQNADPIAVKFFKELLRL